MSVVWKVAALKSACKRNNFLNRFEISNRFEFTMGSCKHALIETEVELCFNYLSNEGICN